MENKTDSPKTFTLPELQDRASFPAPGPCCRLEVLASLKARKTYVRDGSAIRTFWTPLMRVPDGWLEHKIQKLCFLVPRLNPSLKDDRGHPSAAAAAEGEASSLCEGWAPARSQAATSPRCSHRLPPVSCFCQEKRDFRPPPCRSPWCSSPERCAGGAQGYGTVLAVSLPCLPGWLLPCQQLPGAARLPLARCKGSSVSLCLTSAGTSETEPLHSCPSSRLLEMPQTGWRLNHFPGQPVPMLDNPLGEEKFPNIQSKPPLEQLEAISSCPITCYLGEETDPHLATTSFQAVVESDKVSPQPPFLQAKQSQLPQPLLIRLVLQTLHQLRCPSLDTLQHLNVSLVVGGPKLNTVFEVRPHQCRVQGHNHFPSPAGHAIFDTSQDAIGLLGRLGTLLAHIQAAVNKHPQVLFCLAAFQPLFPKPVALHGVVVTQVQDLALGLVEPHTIGPSPSIQPVQVPLQSLPTLQQINTPTQNLGTRAQRKLKRVLKALGMEDALERCLLNRETDTDKLCGGNSVLCIGESSDRVQSAIHSPYRQDCSGLALICMEEQNFCPTIIITQVVISHGLTLGTSQGQRSPGKAEQVGFIKRIVKTGAERWQFTALRIACDLHCAPKKSEFQLEQ
ncbi:hypothetical protein QYF61_015633 [Mycteria americana]|uniref:Uncharacterized protein n=1 Tax=Mycteria americana TaxID=33587 RepID=A0AAN7NPJ5_MYCAM|nr:hypothetical protein QYF61_015633 [Mycteria americana]